MPVGIQFNAIPAHLSLVQCFVAEKAPTPEPCALFGKSCERYGRRPKNCARSPEVVVSDMGAEPRTVHALSTAPVDRQAAIRSEGSWRSEKTDVDQCSLQNGRRP